MQRVRAATLAAGASPGVRGDIRRVLGGSLIGGGSRRVGGQGPLHAYAFDLERKESEELCVVWCGVCVCVCVLGGKKEKNERERKKKERERERERE